MGEYKVDFQKTIEDAFLHYAGAVILRRAIPDVRDGLKYGARQGLYAQFHEGITHDKPYKKAQKSVSAGTSLCYVHGPVSLYGTLVRLAKPFASRYPLEDAQGNFGNPMRSDNHAAERYLEIRQSELASYLFEGIKKNAVERWYANYDDTEQIPSVLPSPFFYNIVNGTSGIGVAMATSIPPFNLREVNRALATLVEHPEATFEELYCPIDFPTGATIINEGQVKESLRSGYGRSAIVRATLEYDARKHQLIVTQMPYMVYTETVCGEIAQHLEEDPAVGIEGVLDATTDVPRIEITLSKRANVEYVKKWLYANTSLQSYFQINMTMLDMGKKPRVFGWREALLAHVTHMREVKRREYQFDLDKAKARLHVVEGLLVAIAHIDEFITLIRGSDTAEVAAREIQKQFGLSEIQAKAILEIKLARLVSLEYVKVEKEKETLITFIADTENLLDSPERFNAMLIRGLDSVTKKFGDNRRTTNIDVAKEVEETKVEITHEETNIIATITNSGSLYLQPATENTKEKKLFITLDPKDYIIDRVYGSRSQSILFFTKNGMAHTLDLNKLEIGKQYSLFTLLELQSTDRVLFAIHLSDLAKYPYIISVSKHAMVKKTSTREFLSKKKGGVAIAKLREDDEFVVARAVVAESDEVLLLTARGYAVRFAQTEVGATGRLTQGVNGAKLSANDCVVDMLVVPKDKQNNFLLTITKEGFLKKTALSELTITNRYVKGTLTQKFSEGDSLALGAISAGSAMVIVGAANSSTKIANDAFPLSERGATSKKDLLIRTGANINYLAEVN